jgi:hypothetical protein
LGGDLNITLSSDEHWGSTSLTGSGSHLYRDLFNSFNLVDVLPIQLIPTWPNGRRGSTAIAKRLACFLISESFYTSSVSPSSGVTLPFFSDHAPITLTLNAIAHLKPFPFKYNHHWADSSDYSALVHSIWNDPRFLGELNPQTRLVWKLSILKVHTKRWTKQKQVAEGHALKQLEHEITDLITYSTSVALSSEEEATLKDMEEKRKAILLDEEKRWCLRSRATWLKWGDSNTKFFHKVANINRNKKHIWSIEQENVGIIRGQEALKSAAASYFELLYKSNSESHLKDKVSTASLYTNLFSAVEAAELYKPVTLTELKTTLSLLKKEKSPGPDGWTTEFFSHFIDLVGSDLLLMVEDARTTGKISNSLNSTFLVLIPKTDQPTSFNDFRPISLCNLVYKLIAKIISSRIKPVLERSLSFEQLGFLKGRRIHDAIGVAHESIHNIFQKKQKALIMKINLKKAFDNVD